MSDGLYFFESGSTLPFYDFPKMYFYMYTILRKKQIYKKEEILVFNVYMAHEKITMFMIIFTYVVFMLLQYAVESITWTCG